MNYLDIQILGDEIERSFLKDLFDIFPIKIDHGNSIYLSSDFSLIKSLIKLNKLYELIKNSAINQILIWELFEKQDQYNGELSSEEIQLMAKLNASYCWSIIIV